MARNTEVPGGMSRGSATRTIVIVGSLVFVALVGVIVALVVVLMNRGERIVYVETDSEPQQRTRVISDDNVEAMVEDLVREPPTPLGYYEVSMNTNWYFPDGDSPSRNAFVENVRNNTHDVYFDVQMRDTEEVIYESPLIPLGERLTTVELNRHFDKGVYDCVIIYHLVDEEQRTVSTLSMGLTVTVES